jgi:hypothetical protein
MHKVQAVLRLVDGDRHVWTDDVYQEKATGMIVRMRRATLDLPLQDYC